VQGNHLLNIIEHIEPGIVILNQDLTVSHISRMFMTLFSNISREQLFQGDILGFHADKDRHRVTDMLRLVSEAKRQIPLSLKLIRSDGHDRFLLIKLIPLVDREMADEKISALFYDITPFIAAERKLTRVPVSSRGEIHLLKPEEIVYFKADNIYTTVCTESGEYHCDLSLGSVEKRLSQEMFHRIHRSYLVNTAKVRKVMRDPQECTVLIDGSEVRLPISRDKMQDFLVAVGLK
jgi:DNA-binding LytR/AlgR family response regulator